MPTTAQADHLSQQDFDFLFPRSKPVLRLIDLPQKLGLSIETVWRLYDSGQISGYSHHTDPQAAKARGTAKESAYRYTKTVTRESVIAYLIRSADYDHAMKLQWTLDLIDTHSKADLHLIATHALQRAARL